MKISALAIAALVSVAAVATAGAASIPLNSGIDGSPATACGAGTATPAPLNLDLIPTKPVVGHQSVASVGDDDGCGEDEHEGRQSRDGEGEHENED